MLTTFFIEEVLGQKGVVFLFSGCIGGRVSTSCIA